MEQNILTIANNTFGLNLFKIVHKDLKGKNMFISPLSISAVLSMTCLGARKNTAQEMTRVLGWKVEDAEKIHKLFQEFLTILQKPSDEYQLATVNRIYLDQTFTVLEEFKSKTKEWYLADPFQADFKENAERESEKINLCVEELTQKKIKDLFAPGVLTADTKMVLVNAIYFKGCWDLKFDKECTELRPFKLASGQTKEVPTMMKKGAYGFYSDSDLKFSAIELPYKGKEHSMLIIVPSEDYDLEELVSKITVKTLNEVIEGVAIGIEILLYLPKFEITSSLMLKQVLSSLGMTDAFNTSNADFTGVTGQRDLVLSEVVHKAFVKVNEEGSEAAAATGVVFRYCCSQRNPLKVFVDRPFLFFIIDKRVNDSVLFLGQVDNPSV